MSKFSRATCLIIIVTFVLIFLQSAGAVPYPWNFEQTDLTGQEDAGESSRNAAASSAPGDVFCLLDSQTVTTQSSHRGSDIWGWQGEDGQEYVIMGVSDGFVFVNSSSMQVVQRITDACGGGGGWRDFKTYQNYCYAVTECTGAGRGMQIIDMSGLPTSIRDLGFFASTTFTGWHNISIDTVRGFAYLANQNNGFEIVSLADPENPQTIGFVNTGGCHDLIVDNDTAYVAESFSPFWSIWDLTDKNNPVRIAHVSIPNAGFVHQISVNANRTIVMTTEETPGKTVKIWDIQNLSNIQLVGEYLGPNNFAHNVFIKGDTAYVSHYSSGVVALDISIPTSPVEIDRFDTYPQSEGQGSNGCWGVFPYTASGKIYASNLSNGILFVFGEAAMGADVTFGAVPVDVQFSSFSCKTATGWNWSFGDGEVSTQATPLHTYNAAGLYSVNLDLQTVAGPTTVSATDFIAVYAETLSIANVVGGPGEQIRVDYTIGNHIPAYGFVIPMQWDGPLLLSYDSVSIQGLRTEFMDGPFEITLDRGNSRAIYLLSSASPVAPGNEPVISLYLRLPPFEFPGVNVINSIGFGLIDPSITFAQAVVPPVVIIPGEVTMGCCKGITGNINADPFDNVNILDLTALINHLFIDFIPLACMEEGNVNGDPDGIVDIRDIVWLINSLYITFEPVADCQ